MTNMAHIRISCFAYIWSNVWYDIRHTTSKINNQTNKMAIFLCVLNGAQCKTLHQITWIMWSNIIKWKNSLLGVASNYLPYNNNNNNNKTWFQFANVGIFDYELTTTKNLGKLNQQKLWIDNPLNMNSRSVWSAYCAKTTLFTICQIHTRCGIQHTIDHMGRNRQLYGSFN